MGLGAGAHGKLTSPTQIVRTVRRKQPREYLATVAPAMRLSDTAAVAAAQLPFEFMLNALRLRAGFGAEEFTSRTGLPITAIEDPLRDATARGLLSHGSDRWQATELGQRFLNDLQALFLPG
jgi:coproporphyrinogen III oxidase-like Fe-S oxidoreductase